jgi:Primosomal protein N'' (replication factor Y) - superfamily II helicase
MSSDNANTPNKVKKIISVFTNKKIDILVATQIMAKGYDFPNLSFVGVIDADAGLFGGDMRAVEKTFNLLQQVSGRAGRSKQAGKVMIQTYYPDQPVIKAIKKRDRKSFVTEALKQRQIFKIPPYGFMTSIIISGASKSLVKNYALKLIQIPKIDRNIELLGPVEATIFLLRGKYRYRILLKGNNRKNLNIFNKKMLNFVDKPSSVKVVVDVDPYSFM